MFSNKKAKGKAVAAGPVSCTMQPMTYCETAEYGFVSQVFVVVSAVLSKASLGTIHRTSKEDTFLL